MFGHFRTHFALLGLLGSYYYTFLSLEILDPV